MLGWEEYQDAASTIYKDVCAYCEKKGKHVDMIVPIIRGGGVLGLSMSHMLNVIDIFPCQYKYSKIMVNNEEKYMPKLLLSTLEKVQSKTVPHVVLVTEGNHARGRTAQECIDLIKSILPQSVIIYACVGRDYAHTASLRHTDFECYGFLTNETGSLKPEECRIKNVKEKYVVYPCENIEEEMMEVVDSNCEVPE